MTICSVQSKRIENRFIKFLFRQRPYSDLFLIMV